MEIAREAKKEKITDLAKNKLSVEHEHLIPFGHFKAKINESGLDELEKRKDGTLILVHVNDTNHKEGKERQPLLWD